MKRYLFLLVCSFSVFLAFRSGEEIGRVGEVNAPNGEIIVKITKTRGKARIGDRFYVRTDSGIVLLKATYPMLTIVKCAVVEEYGRHFSKVRQDMPVYRYVKGIEDPKNWYKGKDPIAGEERIIGGIDFVYVPSGTFMIGSLKNDRNALVDEIPQKSISVDGFWIGKYEVSQKEYKRLMGTNPSAHINENHPVDSVSFDDALAFCKKFSSVHAQCRLPYEAEWEYACRAGTDTSYYWGNKIDASFAWYSNNSGDISHPVAEKKQNAWGLHDMSGNVAEWCKDWYDVSFYKTIPEQNPQGPPGGSFRVVRGGSFGSLSNNLRSAARSRYKPEYRSDDLGFRIIIPSKK